MRSPAARWGVLAVLSLARTAIAFQFQSAGALAPDLVAGLRIDYAGIGTLIGLYMLPGIILAVPGGMLGQRFGDKRVVLYGLTAMVAGGALAASAGSFGTAVAGRLIGGAGGVLVNVLLTKMVTDWFAGREIATALGVFVTSWPLGMGLALVLEPWLAAAWSPAVALHATDAAAALVAALTAAVYRSPDGAVPAARSARPELSRRELGLITLAGMIWSLFNVGYNLLVSFAPAMLVAGGAAATAAGLATSLATWTTSATVLLGGVLTDRLRSATLLMAACFVLLAATMLLAPVAAPVTMIAVAGIVGGIPAGAIMALPAELLRPAGRGPGMGVFFTWYYVGMAALPPLAGAARDLTGLAGAPVLVGGAVEIGALAALVALRLVQARFAPRGAGRGLG